MMKPGRALSTVACVAALANLSGCALQYTQRRPDYRHTAHHPGLLERVDGTLEEGSAALDYLDSAVENALY